MATLIDEIISRLETRNMSVPGLQCTWCASCLRTTIRDPKVKGRFECIWQGQDGCRQELKIGPVSECIAELRREAAERNNLTTA